MAKLLRPHIPITTKLDVAGRQLLAASRNVGNRGKGETMAQLLERRLIALADALGCERRRLHLDHDPALENRLRVYVLCRAPDRRIIKTHVEYLPRANNPDHLIYREGGFRGSDHDVKTRVRGERGQFADNVLAKRERHRVKKAAQKNAPTSKKVRRKYPWPKGRKIQGRNTLRRRS